MGIPIGSDIAKNHSDALTVRTIEDYKGKTASVDGTALLIMQICGAVAYCPDADVYMKSPKYIDDFYAFVLDRYKQGGRAIYLFDGKRDPLKKFENADRDESRAKDEKKAKDEQIILDVEQSKLTDIISKIDDKKQKITKEIIVSSPTSDIVVEENPITTDIITEEYKIVKSNHNDIDEKDMLEILVLIMNQVENRVKEKQENSLKARKRIMNSPTPLMKRNILRFLFLSGIPTILCPFQADPYVAAMVHSGHAHYVFATDFDYLAHGCELLVRKTLDRKNGKPGDLQEFCLSKLLHSMGIDYEQFVNMCLLIGCDYTRDKTIKGVKGLAVISALKLVKTRGLEHDLDAIYTHVCGNSKWKPCEDWLQKAKDAKVMFMDREVVQVPPETEVDIEELTKFFIIDGCKTPEKAKKMVDDLVEAKNKAMKICKCTLVPKIMLENQGDVPIATIEGMQEVLITSELSPIKLQTNVSPNKRQRDEYIDSIENEPKLKVIKTTPDSSPTNIQKDDSFEEQKVISPNKRKRDEYIEDEPETKTSKI